MSNKKLLTVSIVTALVSLTGCSQSVSFQDAVLPILQESCASCHATGGEGTLKSGLVLEDYDTLMRGTKLGPVVMPGSAASSTLYLVISHQVDPKIQMPPHHPDKYAVGEGDPLEPDEIKLVENWIDQGAKNN